MYFSNAAVFIILAKYKSVMNLAKYEEMSSFKQAMENDKLENIVKLNERNRNYMHDMHSY